MKTLVTSSLIIFAILISSTLQAKVVRVNNTKGLDVDYEDLQVAINGSSIGDTIYVEGSVTSYGNITVNKKLTIIGTGYFLTNNQETQANKVSATLGAVSFDTGSSGSTLYSCTVTGNSSINVNNITISRCHISGSLTLGNTTGIVISQCYVTNTIGNGTASKTEVVITNSVLYAVVLYSATLSSVIRNNVFTTYVNTNSGYCALLANNCAVENNVFVYNHQYSRVLGGNYSMYNNIFIYNHGTNDTEGNKYGVALAEIFVNTGLSVDNHFMIIEGSDYKTAGLQGSEVGIFGGGTPYVLSGLAPIPRIYKAEVPSAGSSTLTIKISAKAQN